MAASLFAAPQLRQNPGRAVSQPSPSFATPPAADTVAADPYIALADSADLMMRKSRWGEASDYLLRALKLQPANPLNSLLFSNLGVCQSNTGEYANALQSFEIALIKAPRSPRILTNRARTHLAMADEKLARADLDSALSVDSLYLDALRLRSMLLMRKGDYPAAERDLLCLRRHSAADPWALASLGRCAALKGEPKAASELYREATEGDADADTFVAIALYQLDADDETGMEETLRQAIGRYPREGMPYLLRGVLHKRRFQNRDAEIDKKMAMEYGIDAQTIAEYFPEEEGRGSKKR